MQIGFDMLARRLDARLGGFAVCIALTMIAMNRLSMVKVAIRMNGMKNTQA